MGDPSRHANITATGTADATERTEVEIKYHNAFGQHIPYLARTNFGLIPIAGSLGISKYLETHHEMVFATLLRKAFLGFL